jgi:glycosyltransferase involved in cell wall biosynthesis
MRVLLITSAWPASDDDPRGSFIYRLAVGLTKRGVQIDVVAPAHPTPVRDLQLRGLALHWAEYATPPVRQRLATGLSGIVPNLRRRPWLAAQVPSLVRAMRREAVSHAGGSDLVHAHWLFPGGIAGIAAAEEARLPLIVTCHGSDVNLARRLPPLAWWSRGVLRRADHITAVSHAMYRGLLDLGADSRRLEFLPLGVTLPDDRPADEMPAEWHALRAAPGLRVLFVGGLSHWKSPGTLLEAVRIARREGYEMSIAFVGNGPLRSSLERDASDLAHVWVAGDRAPDEIATWMRACDVLVLPSLAEGRGLVLVEAMACGRAVISSDIPGPDELVHEGRTGFRFPARDAVALADRLARFCREPALIRTLGEGGRRFVESEGLLLEDSVERHISMYERVRESRRIASP